MSMPQVPPQLPPFFILLQQPWQGPAAYWQTVASIMNSRGQTLDALTQQNLLLGQQLVQCRSWADCVGVWSSWQASCFMACTNLALTTQQQRQTLWQTWQLLATRQTPAACFSAWSPTAAAAPAAPITQPLKAVQSPSATRVTPAVSIQPPAPMQASPPPAPQSQASEPQVAAPVQLTEPNPVNTPAAQPLPFPTISRTGDAGVVRTGTGATIAAAAATRRSVVARRTQRKSRLARAR